MAQTILVIDDEPEIRTVAQAALSRLETGDPQRAIQLAREQPIDLLLTDVVMPLMKGTELADRVQAVNPKTRVLLMSGYQTSDIAPSGRPFTREGAASPSGRSRCLGCHLVVSHCKLRVVPSLPPTQRLSPIIMQATEVATPFHRPGWVYEEKVDGYRMLAYKVGASVQLISRQGKCSY
jgi:CheY-like chemotaxis protein